MDGAEARPKAAGRRAQRGSVVGKPAGIGSNGAHALLRRLYKSGAIRVWTIPLAGSALPRPVKRRLRLVFSGIALSFAALVGALSAATNMPFVLFGLAVLVALKIFAPELTSLAVKRMALGSETAWSELWQAGALCLLAVEGSAVKGLCHSGSWRDFVRRFASGAGAPAKGA